MKGLAVVLLVLLRSAPGMEADLYGFSQLVGYFLNGLLTLGSTAVRVIMPNIVGYMAFTILTVMSAVVALGFNPMVCGLAVVVVGDSVF